VSTARRLRAADLARVAAFAALIAALGLPGTISLFGNAVPVTAQTLGVMLAGALLGGRRGMIACLVFLLLVAAGLPLLAGGRGGWSVFTGPSAGYLIGWPLGALVIGLFTERILPNYRFWAGLSINVVGGILVIYAVGIPVQAARVGSGLLAVVQSAVQYLPGDLIKVVVTTVVARQVHRAYPWLVERRRADRDGSA
jgi:biotin transport system substrate-specific component